MNRRMLALGRLKAGEMNKTEAAYAERLRALQAAGEIQWHRFEGLKLRLADNTFYTPDFAVMAADGVMECHEVKGHWQDDARAKIKIAAAMYPFRFIAVTARCRVRHSAGEGNNDQTTPNLTSAWQRFVLEHPVGDDRTEAMSQVWITNRGTGDATVLVDRIEFYDVTDELLISANASATAGLTTAVNQQGTKLDATAQDLTQLKTQVGDVNATAFNQMQATVNQHDGKINANAAAIQGLQVKVEGMPDAAVVQEMQASIGQLSGGNLLSNAAFVDMQGWGSLWSPEGVQGSNNYVNAWTGDLGVPFGCYAMIQAGVFDRQGSIYQWGQDTPVDGGKDYMASAYVSASLRKVHIRLEWLTAAGGMISAETSERVVPSGGGTQLNQYTRLYVKAKAPTNAASCRFALVSTLNTAAGNNSFARWVRPMLAESTPGQDKPGPWSAGGQESRASWQVNVRTDGKVAGLKLESSSGTSAFDILADVFRVSSPGGGQRTEYSDGNWRTYYPNGQLATRMGWWQ